MKTIGHTQEKGARPLLFISTGLGTGGAERMLVKVVSQLDRARFEPCVVSLLNEGTMGKKLADMDVEVICLRMNSLFGKVTAPFKLMKLIRHRRFVAIQGWMYHGSLLAWVGRVLARSRAGLSFGFRHTLADVRRERINTQLVIWLVRWLARRADVCMFNSRMSVHSHYVYGYRPRKITIIPNGFDISAYAPNQKRAIRLRDELALRKCPVVGMVARFDPAKDHHNFLKAAALVRRQCPDARFVLVGTNVSAENPILASWLTELELDDAVLLLGEREDIADLNNAFDIACLSSWMEAFPNVIGEAMACGTPCVVTDVGDSRDIIGDTGIVVPPRDPKAFASAILNLLSMSPKERRALGSKARARVVKYFNMTDVAIAYLAHFEELSQSFLAYPPRRMGAIDRT